MAAADERINRALALTLERHASRDPGSRGTLKRTNVVCHPGSQPQKVIALGTEQAALQRTPVRYRSSSPGTHDSTPTDAGTRDMTHGVTTNKGAYPNTIEVTRGVETGTDNVDDRGGDVVMTESGEGATGKATAAQPSASGSEVRTSFGSE